MGWTGYLDKPSKWTINEFCSKGKGPHTLKSSVPFWGGSEIVEYIIGYEDDDYRQGNIVAWFPKEIMEPLQKDELGVISQNHGSFLIIDKNGIVVWSDIHNIFDTGKHFYEVCCCKNNIDRACRFCGSFKEHNLENYKYWNLKEKKVEEIG